MPLASSRCADPRHNGVKRAQIGTREGYFVAINLLAPRSPSQMPADKLWYSDFTIVQLVYSFVTGPTSRPVGVGRTFMTFCARHKLPPA